jgi:hypothetical protein
MRFILQREPSLPTGTFGQLRVEGFSRMCWTLEPIVREDPLLPVYRWKKAGETAIPAGTYRIYMRFSAHFGIAVPGLDAVEGFEQIEIHPGNTVKDTKGCIMPGLSRDSVQIYESRKAFDRVLEVMRLVAQTREVPWITVLNAASGPPEIVASEAAPGKAGSNSGSIPSLPS